MTREEFLIDTIEYFATDPISRRNISQEGICTYTPIKSTSQGCAIGRFMTPHNQIIADKIQDINIIMDTTLLPKEIKELGTSFLCDVQLFHDENDYFDEYGLTERGMNYINSLIDSYNLNIKKKRYK